VVGPNRVEPKACPVLEQLVDVGGVRVEPDDVGEGHVGVSEDGFEVVER
jgi:hypothetical protein